MGADSEMFWAHVELPEFQAGLDNGYWGLLQEKSAVEWPFVLIWVKAATKANCPDRYVFRFDLAGYPQQAPTACPWDIDKKAPLAPNQWPRGPRHVSKVFNPGWRTNALYAPCDREPMKDHGQWRQTYRGLWWESTFTIVVYLRFIHRLLTSEDNQHG
jgi:hypothetical protein